MTSTAEILRGLPYFSDLPDELLSDVCDKSHQLDIAPDKVIIEEGTSSEEMYVVVDGELVVTKRTGDKHLVLARLGPGEVVGEMALLDQAPRTATVTASQESRVIRIPVSAFEELLQDPRLVRRMFKTVTSRLRDIEETLRHEERMAALGRMAAQLMHELNNPAAAVARSTDELIRLYESLGEEASVVARALMGEREPHAPTPPSHLSALERADREEAVAGWLEGKGVEGAWDLAPALVDAGWDPDGLEEATAGMDQDLATHFARWLGLRTAAEQVIGEIGIGARRISELVRVVKDYSYLDQAPVQEVNLSEGIRDTLILLKGKLRDIDVSVDIPEDLHAVEAPGRDLNQVWTNLIDNAADAMEEQGKLSIVARNDGDHVVVEVSDTGSGIPEEKIDRIFDPFFTTKEPGKGTGLGLHTVHTLVNRAGGEISVTSDPTGSTFQVRLPAVV